MRIPVGAAFAAAVATIAATGGAGATDLYVEPPPYAGTYGAPPAPARVYAAPPVYVAPPAAAVPVVPGPMVEERCRVRHKVTVDPYGREVVRRIRICDEGVVAPYAARPSFAGEPFAPPRYGEYAPRPPANVSEGYRRREFYRAAPPAAWDDNPDVD